MKKVFLDAGHGGKDPGSSGNGLIEKHIALPVALKTGEILKRHNVDVSYSRTTDTFIELSNRANRANVINSDIFLSLHTNAFSDINAQGLETYSHTGSTNGKILATNIHNAIVEDKLYTKNRGTKTANFAVLKNTKMPAVLVELGFITNVEDATILRNKQNELAESVARGILNHLGIKCQDDIKKPSTSEIEGQNGKGSKGSKVRIKKDGKVIEVDGFLQNDSNYVKVRDVFEKLGYEVSWNNENKIVVID